MIKIRRIQSLQIELSLDTGNYYYTMEINSSEVWPEIPRKVIAYGVDELPRDKFVAFLKTLKEINFDTIVDQWEAFQS